MSTLAGTEAALTPFLKWAGGKRWFADRYMNLLPTKFNRFIEPFLGSGAMYFALQPPKSILSDINDDLMNCYRAVRDKPAEIFDLLSEHQSKHNKEYYYTVRKQKPSNDISRAAWLLYLNRTCWNGLYRVNQRNEFNVPIGTKTGVILPNDDFERSSLILQKAHLLSQDFEKTLSIAGLGDLVFVDPPYTVKHNLNGFVKYNDKIFSWTDQIRLRDAVAEATRRGAAVLVTNANHSSIREIYRGVGRMQTVRRASVLAASANNRGPTEELVIQTWIR